MKKIMLILIIALLCASVSEAYVYRTIGTKILPKFTGAATGMTTDTAGLGRVQFSLHPYTIGTPQAASVRPGTPMVAKIEIAKKATGNPPVTEEETATNEGVTILVTEIKENGETQIYSTNNVQGNVLPSDRFTFDHNPSVQAWTNDKFVANQNINTRMKYIILVKYKEDTKVLEYTLNVR